MKLAWILALAGLTSCTHAMPFIWVDALPPAALAPDAYRVQSSDLISILVWNQTKMSAEVKVRSDGQVTLPLIGDVAVAGLTPTGAAQVIERRLDGLVIDPKVTVTIREARPPAYSVVGEVKNSGSYPLPGGIGILQALATAGGFTEFADREAIYVIRRDPELKRIRFAYRRLAQADGRGVLFQLRDGDIIVVE